MNPWNACSRWEELGSFSGTLETIIIIHIIIGATLDFFFHILSSAEIYKMMIIIFKVNSQNLIQSKTWSLQSDRVALPHDKIATPQTARLLRLP